jgi:hypothetical protein
MKDEARRSSMTSCIDELLALMTSRCGLELCSGKIELVVELARGGRDHHRVCRYYFVDHPNRLLFWLHEIRTERIFDGVLGVEKWSHASASSYKSKYHCVLDSLHLQSMLSNISIGKSVIVCIHYLVVKSF